MSGIISMAFGDVAMLLTDGATYDDDGTVRRIGCKVTTSKQVSFAVTSRGSDAVGNVVAERLCHMADEIGVSDTLAGLHGVVHHLSEQPDLFTGDNATQFVIAAWDAKNGGQHCYFQTNGEKRFEVRALPEIQSFGPSFSTADATLVSPKRSAETLTDYIRRVGADFMEIMRKRPGRRDGACVGDMFFGVGGQCDLTVIDRNGAKVETIRTWNDAIGERINPFGLFQNVAVLGSRKERRAAKAQGRKVA
ncbi:hypothetical protein [Pararhizobium gei]|uniref:hypothetical protein n=1 Tax=Pararhizobium gei TaxID=1395951 RepID=UPI0023D998A5|nr:hypothetical protein [Rhizobium gei]